MTDWDGCYEKGMGDLSYPDEVIVQTIHHMGLHPYHRQKALDLGCGSGRHLEMLHRQGYEVWAADGSEQALKIVEGRLGQFGLHTVQIQFPPVRFPDRFFDVVLMVNVLEHNMQDARREIVSEVFRVLKGGGVYLSRHAGWTGMEPMQAAEEVEDRGWKRDSDTFIYLATEEELLETMVGAGFSSVEVGTRQGWYPWLPWLRESEIYVLAEK